VADGARRAIAEDRFRMTNRFSTSIAASVFALLVLTAPGFAAEPAFSSDQALIAMGLCEEMGHLVNVMVDYTATKCIPALMTKGTNFIFVSEKPVFLVEASKKAWMIVVVAVVGKTLNNKPTYKSDKILFGDVSMVKEKHYYTVPAALAKSLQPKVYNGEISVETMWGRITSALTPYPVPAK
jgi:hypothetical protein